MRVAVLFEYESLNGGEYSWLSVVPYLQSAGVRLCAIAPAAGTLAKALAERNIEHIAWPWSVGGDYGGKRSQPDLRSQLAMVLTESKPDLVHANSLSMSRTLGPLAADLELPCIGHLRDILRLSSQVLRDLNGNHRLLAVSEATRQFHVAQGLDATKTHVLYNGVDLQLFRPASPTGYLHRELGLPRDARLILTIGQIGIRKGLDVGMDALDGLFAAREDIHWVVVGQRHSQKEEAIQYAETLFQRSRKSPFAGRVHWLGRRSDVPLLLREAALLLHPAKQEPLGRVLLEAAATGRPIVTTPVGGNREIFGDGSQAAARMVSVDDVQALRSAIAELLAEQALSRELGTLARQRAEALFPVENAAHSLLGHYRQAAARDDQ